MTLAELEAEILMIAGNDVSVSPFVYNWILRAVDQIAMDFHLPALKRIEPYALTTVDETWLYNLPTDYHKNLFEARNGVYSRISILSDISTLIGKDPDHDETGTVVTAVAVQNLKIGIYPKADDTVNLWYYRKPGALVTDAGGDADARLDCIPDEFHARLIIPKVVVMNLDAMIDSVIEPPLQSVNYWHGTYSRGLYGSPRGDLGFVHWLARHGGNKPDTTSWRNPFA